ncbi:MAG TPA: hypothetical protein VG917_04310 [Patescibacteria group bacterium]|nr:hypothetical protein [Patescibacteria group bacterium]
MVRDTEASLRLADPSTYNDRGEMGRFVVDAVNAEYRQEALWPQKLVLHWDGAF